MNRYQTMVKLKSIYEEILVENQASAFLERESDIDQLYAELQSNEREPYTDSEMDILGTLLELHQRTEELLSISMSELKRAQAMSSRVSKQYDNYSVTDSYFYDRKL